MIVDSLTLASQFFDMMKVFMILVIVLLWYEFLIGLPQNTNRLRLLDKVALILTVIGTLLCAYVTSFFSGNNS